MIRRGKTAGWLASDRAALSPWMLKHGIATHGVCIETIGGHEAKGLGIIATEDADASSQSTLVTVPRQLILSKQTVQLHASTDKNLKEVLVALGDFGTSSRGSILIFLLTQATYQSPQTNSNKIGVISPLVDYIKCLPLENLPTFWSQAEETALEGTSLGPALRAKLRSLEREFVTLQKATENVEWCKIHWWGEDHNSLSFEDWKQVDAMYRSRALEFPGIGDCMVPIIDMANHAPGVQTSAIYEVDANGDAILMLRDGMKLRKGDEVTITYGDNKGACEMLFSYGFLEQGQSNARSVFLNLQIPEDDPLLDAKRIWSTAAPGVRLLDNCKSIEWASDFVWLVCVNEEDGLGFEVVQRNEQAKELQAQWRGQKLHDASDLKSLLQTVEMWPIYNLRAVVFVQERVEQQLHRLLEPQQDLATDFLPRPETGSSQSVTYTLRLKTMETGLLQKAYETLESEKTMLLNNDIVRMYLNSSMEN